MLTIQPVDQMNMNNEETDIQQLKIQWRQLRKKNKGIRIRNAAKLLNVSEAELLATGETGNVVYLFPDWVGLFSELVNLESVMLLTRDDAVVHEVTGKCQLTQSLAQDLLITGEGFELQLDSSKLHHVFAVEENTRGGGRQSLQFFDAVGDAVCKIYLTEWSRHAVYYFLLSRFRDYQYGALLLPTHSLNNSPSKTTGISIPELKTLWEESASDNAIDKQLQACGLNWQHACELLGQGYCFRICVTLLHEVLSLIAQQRLAVIIRVKNDHAQQQFRGVIENIRITGDWLNVLDKNFNLHINQTEIASAWVVHKSPCASFGPQLQFLNCQGKRSLVMACATGESEPAVANVWQDVITGLEAFTHDPNYYPNEKTDPGEDDETL